MPNKLSAIKALRQNKKRQALNLIYKKQIKETWKKGDLKLVYKALDKAAKKGVISFGKANRKKSQASQLARSLANNPNVKA